MSTERPHVTFHGHHVDYRMEGTGPARFGRADLKHQLRLRAPDVPVPD